MQAKVWGASLAPLYLGAGITQYKPEAAPWAQYAVMFAVVSPGR